MRTATILQFGEPKVPGEPTGRAWAKGVQVMNAGCEPRWTTGHVPLPMTEENIARQPDLPTRRFTGDVFFAIMSA